MLAKSQKPRRVMDPTIPMLDMAFQILIFFLLAGSIAAPLAPDLTLVRVAELEQVPPPSALVLHADGRVTWQGETADLVAFMAAHPPETAVQILPDRDASASALVALGAELRRAGASKVVIVSERGLPQ